MMNNMCQAFLTSMRRTARTGRASEEVKAAVLGDADIGFTVELQDGTQIEVGKQCCRYCARVEAIQKLADMPKV